MKILIVDDEPLARRRLVRLLARIGETEVVGEAGDAGEAQRLTDRLAPDLLLLDIDMPGLDGLSLAASLKREGAPAVVFTTAHAKHALDAFAVAAVDYLLKPIEEARLCEALERVRQARRVVAAPAPEVASVLREVLRERTTPVRLAARAGDSIELLDPSTVTRLHASDKYTLCQRGERELVLDESLSVLEARLAPLGFFRTHRSELVNLHRVRALRTELEGTFVELDDGQRAQVSRRALSELKERLGIG